MDDKTRSIEERLAEHIEELISFLEEAHREELDSGHGGDDYADCSYCNAIESARLTLKEME